MPATPVSRGTGSLFNPFPGLRAFEPDEDYLYFGRERQIDELLHRLGENRLLAAIGTSGSGKSSLVRAGLVPALHSGYLTRAGSSWRVAILRPGGDPIGNLAAALDEPAVLGGGEELGEAGRMILESTLRASSLGLADCVRQAAIPAADNVLVLVDQFEELFRFKHSAQASRDEAVAFVKLLLEAAASDQRIYVVLTMRSEFIGDCMEFPGLPEAINQGQYLVPRMTRDELRLAITGPIGVRGAEISPRLVARLLNDIEDDRDQLPVLQHALMRMWSHWELEWDEKGVLDLEHYEAIGTLSEALSRHAESAYQQLESAGDRRIAEQLFKALTDTDREGRGVRRPVPIREICDLTGTDVQAVVRVIDVFRARGRSFLMPPPAVPLGADSVVDLAHESLMRNWTRLVDWAREEAESAEVYQRLSQAAALAEAGEGSLWRSPELDIGLRWREKARPTAAWARRYDPELERAMDFLDRSRRRRKAKVAAFSLAVLAVGALVSGYFYLQGVKAERQARLQAVLSASDPLVRALILAEIDDTAGLVRGLEVAQEVASAAIPRAVLRGHDGPLVGVAFSEADEQVTTVSSQGVVSWWRSDGTGEPRSIDLRAAPPSGEPPLVRAVAFSADGRWLAAGFTDGALVLSPRDPRQAIEPRVLGRRDDGEVVSIALSPDGRRIAAGYADYEARIWTTDGGELRLGSDGEQHAGPVAGIAFSADGETVATSSWDGTVRIWNASDGGLQTRLDGGAQNGAFQSAAFSSDGEWVICARNEGSVLLWRRDGSGETVELKGSGGSTKDAAFSPDGSRVVAAFDDRSAQIWSLRWSADGRPEPVIGSPAALSGHAGAVNAVAFSRSGDQIATVSDDGTARIWPSEPGEPRVLGQHDHGVESVALSLDGNRVISGSRDGTARIWWIDSAHEPVVLGGGTGHTDWVRSAMFDRAGTRALTGSEDDTFRVWDLDRDSVRVFMERSAVLSAAFDAAGSRVATGTRDRSARIWHLDDGGDATPVDEHGHDDWVWSSSFSADGTRLLTASRDGTARIWSLGSADGSPRLLEGHRDQVRSARFSPSGDRVVTASNDGTARIWSVADSSKRALVLQHKDKVNDASFSADGGWVVTASEDGTARIWSAQSGAEWLVLRHGSPVRSAAFEPGMGSDRDPPSHVVTGAEDGSVRIWKVSVPVLIDYARDISTACLTQGQRVRFLAESERVARHRSAECERRFGREPWTE